MQTQEWNEANIPRREIPVMINRGPNWRPVEGKHVANSREQDSGPPKLLELLNVWP